MSLIARLIEAGTPPDLIEEVAMLIAEQRALEKRRANDRQRQQDKRDKDAGHVTSRDVTDVTACHTGGPFPAPPNENNLTPPTHTPEKQTPRARGKHPMPIDWEPKALTGDTAQAVAGWPPGSVERELARFRDWAAGGGPNTRKENWDATWRNWLRRAQDEGRYRHGNQQRSQSGGASTIDAYDRAMQLTGGPTGCDPSGTPGGAGAIGTMPDAMRSIGHVQ